MLCEYSETHGKQMRLRDKQPVAMMLVAMLGRQLLQGKLEMDR